MDKVKARDDLNEAFKTLIQLTRKMDDLQYTEEILIEMQSWMVEMLDAYKN